MAGAPVTCTISLSKLAWACAACAPLLRPGVKAARRRTRPASIEAEFPHVAEVALLGGVPDLYEVVHETHADSRAQFLGAI